MYNGIGLLTARGSGTSGYVTNNKFNLRGNAFQRRDEQREERGPDQRQPNAGILEHNKKRAVELEVEVMRAQLEDDGTPEDEVEEKLNAYRSQLLAKLKEEASAVALQHKDEQLKQETHQIAARKVEQMGRLRGAFGIGETKEGDAFDRELQDRRRQEKIAERENREQERRKAAKRAEKEKRRAEREREREAKSTAKAAKKAAKQTIKDAKKAAEEAEAARLVR
ncbi:Pre-mRNA-splicing factor CWC21 [Auxenochlorella protothecoides]|uniref:Pre-mRNA-splicing factor CWC21 n=1 Tax=Auxenochlorella protothecoides TaxID=3075 RepID=A0A087SDM1_AUXPR|nr:Pre-mRNA-splicing factor CWC21 [Auxenochlorella protothecoides]KFM23825.1 Pre-mRNA-splicing factor CWC21 [Auxenochlorella protothecoides]